LKKKILFNCTINKKGGAVYNSANYIEASIINETAFDYFYAVSSEVFSNISTLSIDPKKIVVFESSPSRSIYARRALLDFEAEICPDLVFTMAGPAYVKFSSTHLMGCSNPYIIFASLKDIKFGRNSFDFCLRVLQTLYQAHYSRIADHFLFQTTSSMYEFNKKYRPKGGNFVIENSIALGETLNSKAHRFTRLLRSSDSWINILCPFEDYPHKGAHILPSLCERFYGESLKVRFILTAHNPLLCTYEEEGETPSLAIAQPHILRVGRVGYKEMSYLYDACDVVFMPSVLEVFSSVCIEALFSRTSLVIADRPFNREIAGNFAKYCEPSDTENCFIALKKGIESAEDYDYLNKGKEYSVEKYGIYKDRFLKITDLLSMLTV